jgi:hypothetical protein
MIEGSTALFDNKNGDTSAAAAYKANILAKIELLNIKSYRRKKYNLDLFYK